MPSDTLFLAVPDPQARSALLDDWVWLTGPGLRPLLFTACGDVFLHDAADGAVHFLDVNGAQLSRIADTVQAFEARLADPAFVGDYLGPKLVDALRRHGKLLAGEEVYSFRIPLALGGEVTVENVEVVDLAVHMALTGQIARQLKDVPDGAPVGKLEIRLPTRKPWWKFW